LKTPSKKAILCANLGSPTAPDVASVREYLNEFLMDPQVIQLPWLLRRMIVSLFVLPKRPFASALAYQSIWREKGSPLVASSMELLTQLQQRLSIPVEMSMRYGSPSIEGQILKIVRENPIEELLFIPLYPHYADSTIKTSVLKVEEIIQNHQLNIKLSVQNPFYQDEKYIEVLANSISPYIEHDFEHILFSYHGLPLSHLKTADPTHQHCLKLENCCTTESIAHKTCYKHQTLITTQKLVEKLQLKSENYSLAFQSRLGRAKWLEPSTHNRIIELASQGVKNLKVVCPAFVTDCLETLEEIEIQAKETFQQAGGQELTLIPCLNVHQQWVDLLVDWCGKFENSIPLNVENI